MDECLKCENGDSDGILPTNIGEGQNDDLFGDELISNELPSTNGFGTKLILFFINLFIRQFKR